MMNKYHKILEKILNSGKIQANKKGNIIFLLNEILEMKPIDLLDIFEGHPMAKKKLKDELQLFISGERQTEKYRNIGVFWWDYCGQVLVNSYPTYFEQLPRLIEKINAENVHIYENNKENTAKLLNGQSVKFDLNVG
jgi:thymidylate synthase